MTLLSTAYAGSADIDPENIDALLNQILPDGPLGMVYIPEEIPRRAMPGLTKVVAWLEKELGKEGTIPVKSPVEALLERNSKLEADGADPEELDELVLVMLYSPDSDGDVSLAKEALGHGIRVVDLTAAGDDLIIEDEAPPAEPEPPAATEPDVPAETPAARVRKATAAGVAAAKTAPEPEPAPAAPAGTPGIVFQLQLNIDPEHVATLARAIVEAMGAQAQAVVEAPSTASAIGTTGGNVADPAGQPQGTAVYYHNTEAATYRPARGTKRKGEERVFLTPDEVAEARTKGMLG